MLVLDRRQGYLLECHFHSFPVLRRGSQVLDPWMLPQELGNARLLHFSLRLPVDLIPHQDEGELLRLFRGSLVQELCDPGFDIVERLLYWRSTFLLVMS